MFLELFHYVRDLIALRKAHSMFRLRTREQIPSRVKFLEAPNEKLRMFTIRAAGVPGETCIKLLELHILQSFPVSPPAWGWSPGARRSVQTVANFSLGGV